MELENESSKPWIHFGYVCSKQMIQMNHLEIFNQIIQEWSNNNTKKNPSAFEDFW
jgi:hypothetical protein